MLRPRSKLSKCGSGRSVSGLAGEDGAAVDVKDFAGDEAGERSTEEEDGAGDLHDVAGAADGDGGVHPGGDFGVSEDGVGHLGPGPAGSDAVGVDAVRSEFGGEALGEGDERAFAGGVVGVEGLATLAGGGGNQNDVAAGTSVDGGAGEHVGGGGVDEAEDAVVVNRLGAAPLGGGHGGDGGLDGRPDAVVGDEDVEVAEGCDGGGDECLAVFRCGEILLHGKAEGGAAAFGCERLGLGPCLAIAEGNARSGQAEEAHCGGADAARTSGDERGVAGEGERDSSDWI